MKMTVRTLMLAAVLVVLGTSSVFGQVYSFGSPTGGLYNGPGGINLAVSREGNREVMSPVTICANVNGAAGSGVTGAAGSFDVGDVFQILYGGAVVGAVPNTPPLLATLGALGVNQVAIFQSAAGGTLTANAAADIYQPPAIGGAAPPPPQSRVTVTITGATAGAAVVGCISIQNLRFDIANTFTIGGVSSVGNLSTFGATVVQSFEATPAPGASLNPNVAVPYGNSTNAALLGGQQVLSAAQLAVVGTQGMGSAFTTLGTVGFAGVANATGCTTGGASLAANQGVNGATVVFINPACANVPGAVSTVPQVVQNSGTTATGTISIQENLATPAGVFPVNLGISLGGGLLRNFASAGASATTLLNLSGATTGTQVEIAVSTMPVGSSMTFGSTASTTTPGATLTLTLVGSGTITAPSGVVTYVVSNNEGPSTGAAGSIGPSVEIPYTVSELASAGATGVARYVIRLRPATTGAETPKYVELNGLTVIPSQVISANPSALYWVSTNQTTRLFPFVVFNGNTPSSYDTGLAYTNTGKNASVSSTGVASYLSTGAQGQDGTFTVFFVSSSGSVTSIKSDDPKFPDGSKILSSGKLKIGDTWLALMSDFVTAGTIKGNFTGSLVVVADFPFSQGFAFISQFTNPAGGATMGYVALQQAR